MFVPIIMIIMIFGMTPFVTHSQETPPKTMTEEEIANLPEYKDLMQSQMAIGNFTGNENSEEFKVLTNDMQQKYDAFNKIVAEKNRALQENTAPTSERDTITAAEASEKPIQETNVVPAGNESTPTQTETPEQPAAEVPATPPANIQEGATAENKTTATPEQPTEKTPAEPVIQSLEEQETLIPEEPISEEPISEEPVGIDTVSLENPQGNWLFKRIWWERAEERYEKIRNLVDAIGEQRNTFFKERNQLDRNILDPFYMNIGIDRGELQTILSEITDFLEQQREQQGELSEQERILYETYATEEETLKQLKLDVDMITSLDQAIDDALGTFMNQINRVKNYESEAWKNFKEIAHILNDARARELYYMIEGAARNIKTISIYLEQEFFTHFHKLIEEAKTRVARVQNQMEALKEKGVLFQKQAEQLEQQMTSEEQENEEEEEATKPKPKVGWIDWMIGSVSDVFGYIWSIIRLPYDMIFGK